MKEIWNNEARPVTYARYPTNKWINFVLFPTSKIKLFNYTQ